MRGNLAHRAPIGDQLEGFVPRLVEPLLEAADCGEVRRDFSPKIDVSFDDWLMLPSEVGTSAIRGGPPLPGGVL